MAKENPETQKLIQAIVALDGNINNLVVQQIRTNDLLKRLIESNSAFLGTLTSFLDLDHRLKLAQERERLEQAKSKEPTRHDFIY